MGVSVLFRTKNDWWPGPRRPGPLLPHSAKDASNNKINILFVLWPQEVNFPHGKYDLNKPIVNAVSRTVLE